MILRPRRINHLRDYANVAASAGVVTAGPGSLSQSGVGSDAWSDLNNLLALDGSVATCTNSGGNYTSIIAADDFDLSAIPSDATVVGLRAAVLGFAVPQVGATFTCEAYRMRYDGSVTGVNRADELPDLGTELGVVYVGGQELIPEDAAGWTMTITNPDQYRDTLIGFQFRWKHAGSNAVEFSLDYCYLQAWWQR